VKKDTPPPTVSPGKNYVVQQKAATRWWFDPVLSVSLCEPQIFD
jgi:hypothetical protein